MSDLIKPITPEEVINRKRESIPAAIFETFNKLITDHWNGYQSKLYLKEVVRELTKRFGFKESEIFHHHWLDVENIYREAGWEVDYDQPAYNESYDAYYLFRSPRKGS